MIANSLILMTKTKNRFIILLLRLKDHKGQGLVEYALLLLLITIVVFAMVVAFGRQLNSTYEVINSGVQNAGK